MKLNPAWDIAFALMLALTGYWYWRQNKLQATVSTTRQILFYAGLGVLALMLVGPVPHAAINTFWVHMVQHISLMMLISPLLVLCSPFKLLL